MADFDPFDFSDMNETDEQIAADTKPAATRNKFVIEFDCIECGGSGLWQSGRRNVHGNPNCWTCGGRGKVKTDPRKLRDNRVKRAQKKVDNRNSFMTDHADTIAAIAKAADWSSFAASLIQQLNEGKLWTDKQLLSAQRMADKLAAKAAERAAARKVEQVAAQVAVDLGPIRAMFEAAVANGYKRPTYRAEGLVISRAPDGGRNPGALYVKNEADVYGGKVLGVAFDPTREGRAADYADGRSAADALALIAVDPLAAALRYGQRTGRCACCGRELTNHTSIDLGIGPICRQKWGL